MDREVSLILKNLGYLLQNRLYLCFFKFIRYTWSVVILNSTYKSFIDLTSSSLCERSATEKSKSSIEPLGIFLLGKKGVLLPEIDPSCTIWGGSVFLCHYLLTFLFLYPHASNQLPLYAYVCMHSYFQI